MDTLDELLDSLTTESADAEQQSEADLSYIDETAPEDILQHHDTAPHDGSGDAIEANPAFQVEGIEGDAQTVGPVLPPVLCRLEVQCWNIFGDNVNMSKMSL